MARKRVKTWREEEPSRARPGAIRLTLRAIKTAAAVLLVLYVAGFFAVHSDGFRDIVSQRLERHLGVPVRVESVSANWRYDLTLHNIVSEGTRNKNSPGLRAQRVALHWSFGDLFRQGRIGLRDLDLERCVITFARSADGTWQPQELAPLSHFLAKWLQVDLDRRVSTTTAVQASAVDPTASTGTLASADATRAATKALQEARMRLALRRGEITWWDEENGDVPLAALEGVTLTATPVQLPNRVLTHYYLKLEHAASASGLGVSNMTLELLDTGDQQLVLVLTADQTTGWGPGGNVTGPR